MDEAILSGLLEDSVHQSQLRPTINGENGRYAMNIVGRSKYGYISAGMCCSWWLGRLVMIKLLLLARSLLLLSSPPHETTNSLFINPRPAKTSTS
jgi:hypothetical protein